MSTPSRPAENDRLIRPATEDDGQAIAAIYNHYVEHTVVTFEETPVPAADMSRRIGRVSDEQLPWLVAEEDGRVAGYAYATRWRERSAYRHSVEITVYVDPSCPGRGLGSGLYGALFAELRLRPVHVLIGGITLPNPASVALHEKFGMVKVAHFREVGYKFGQWLDVGYWQVALQG